MNIQIFDTKNAMIQKAEHFLGMRNQVSVCKAINVKNLYRIEGVIIWVV